MASRVVRVTRAEYPDVRAIPYHSRWRHFGVGGVDRVRALDERMRAWGTEERLAAHVDLAVTSVLLDAGAGDRWVYRDANGGTYARSEGLAVASYDLFASGAFSSDPARVPWRADAAGLSRVDEAALAGGMQAAPTNALVGLGGRAALLRRLGEVVASSPEHFAHPTDPAVPPRIGHLGLRLRATARGGELPAGAILTSLLSALGPIWPRRIAGAPDRGEAPAGDVWRHSTLGIVPLHKLSQWLAYSLCEPIEWSGVRVAGIDALTGLAEYRNGGLFVDGGVLVPLDPAALDMDYDAGSDSGDRMARVDRCPPRSHGGPGSRPPRALRVGPAARPRPRGRDVARRPRDRRREACRRRPSASNPQRRNRLLNTLGGRATP